MVFKPPTVLEILWDLTLRNGNVHRLQLVRFSDRPKAVVSLECREYVRPDRIPDHRGAPIQYTDDEGYGMGLTKGLRSEHLEWLLEHDEQVRAAWHKQRVATMANGIDGWGRRV